MRGLESDVLLTFIFKCTTRGIFNSNNNDNGMIISMIIIVYFHVISRGKAARFYVLRRRVLRTEGEFETQRVPREK